TALHGWCQERACLDRSELIFQISVCAILRIAGVIGAGGNVCTGQCMNRCEKVLSGRATTHIAGVEQQICSIVQRFTPSFNLLGKAGERFLSQPTATEFDQPATAMTDEM